MILYTVCVYFVLEKIILKSLEKSILLMNILCKMIPHNLSFQWKMKFFLYSICVM